MKHNGAATAAGIISVVLAAFVLILSVILLVQRLAERAADGTPVFGTPGVIALLCPFLLSGGLFTAGIALLLHKARAVGVGLILCAVSWLFLSVRFLFTDPGVLAAYMPVIAAFALSPALPLALGAALAFERGKFKKLWFLPPALLAAEYLVFAVWSAAVFGVGFPIEELLTVTGAFFLCAAAALIAFFLCCLWLGGIEDGENGAYSS